MVTAEPSRIGLADIVRGVAGIVPDLGSVVRQLPNLRVGTTSKPPMSIGKKFQQVAGSAPERPFLRFHGRSSTYGECNRRVNRYAAELARRGVSAGDVVAIMAKNHPDVVLAVLATVKLGAVAGMVNYHHRGPVLEHSLRLLDAKLILSDSETTQALSCASDAVGRAGVLPLAKLDESSASLAVGDPAIEADRAVTATLPPSSTAFYIFTSGTTGMPKASVMTHRRWLTAMAGIGGLGIRLRPHDTMYASLPFYHNTALTVALSSVLTSGACLAIGEQFSASNFWDDIALNRATAFCYIGELCRYLLAQPEKDTDRTHSVRLAAGSGLRAEIWDEFTERFGIERVVEFYSASEANIGFVNVLNLRKTVGFCPVGYAVVDFDEDTGLPVRGPGGYLVKTAKGEAGLLVAEINARAPFDGYTDPTATDAKVVSDAFRAGDRWFNTGDLVRDQGYHHVAFVDRLGDTFRWKGENVATTEVEAALNTFPDVAEAVVFGVDIPGADGKAGMAAVRVRADRQLDRSALARHLYDSLPAYAVPLFVRVVDEFERTSTFKNVKFRLRQESHRETGADPVYVLAGYHGGYVDRYADYLRDVSSGVAPRDGRDVRRGGRAVHS